MAQVMMAFDFFRTAGSPLKFGVVATGQNLATAPSPVTQKFQEGAMQVCDKLRFLNWLLATSPDRNS